MLSDLLVANAKAGDRQVLITEVTRMTGGIVCVAGLDVATGRMVRPLQPDGSNWDEATWVKPGLFRVGSVVGLKPAPTPAPGQFPHATEDFRCSMVTPLAVATDRQLYRACVQTADTDLESIFANQVVSGKYVIDGTESRSLGCVLVDADALRLAVHFDKVQVSWQDPAHVWHNLPVTELAIRTPEADVGLGLLRSRLLHVTGKVALRVGLGRGWEGADGSFDPKRCYLQLNGLIVPA